MTTSGPSRCLTDMWVPEEVRPGVEAIAAADPNWAASLAHNPWLTEPTWHLLYDRHGSNVEIVKTLVSRPLTDSQLDRVVTSERRASVLAAAFAVNPVTDPSQLATLADRKVGTNAARALVGHLLDFGFADEALPSVLPLAVAGGAHTFAGVVAEKVDRLDDTVCRDAVLAAAALDRLGIRTRHDVLRILTARPHLVDGLVGVSVMLDQVLAGSALIGNPARQWRIAGVGSADIDEFAARRFLLLALIANPYCDRKVAVRIEQRLLAVFGTVTADVRTDVHWAVRRRDPTSRPTVTDLTAVSDPEVLRWLVSRATGFDNRGPRPFEAAALAANPNLLPWMVGQLLEAIADPEVVRCIGRPEAQRLFATLEPRGKVDVVFPDRPVPDRNRTCPLPAAYEQAEVYDDDLSSLTVASLWRPSRSLTLARTLRVAYLRFGDDPAAYETLRNLIDTFDRDTPITDLLDLVPVL